MEQAEEIIFVFLCILISKYLPNFSDSVGNDYREFTKLVGELS